MGWVPDPWFQESTGDGLWCHEPKNPPTTAIFLGGQYAIWTHISKESIEQFAEHMLENLE